MTDVRQLAVFAGADDLLDRKIAEQRAAGLTTPGLTRAFANIVDQLPTDAAVPLLCVLLATAVQRLAHPEGEPR